MVLSFDFRYVYFDTGSEVRRVRRGDHHAEVVASMNGLHRVLSSFGQWFGLAPDDSPLVRRDVGSHEIYALDRDAP